MASRRLSDLHPDTRRKVSTFLALAEDAHFPVLIYCTYREDEEQARLFRQGRTISEIVAKAEELRTEYGRMDLAKLLMDVGPQYGRRVTNAGPGQSLHRYRYAADGVPLRDGKPIWDDEVPEDKAAWARYGELAEAAGLEWSGRWQHFKETPHIQEPGVRWQDLIREGR